MSQLNGDGVLLFACTKCNSRHPFEDLSQGHQLCKECRNSYQVLKCNYCRTEYHQEHSSGSSSRSSSICKKCEQLQEQHGKPGPCTYCNIIAAFIGTKCQRCTNSEKKYGPPFSCEHCRQKCAFDRKDPEGQKKVDNKLLCWLCTMAYKRTLAKARQKEAALKFSSTHQRSSSNRHNHHGSASSNGQRHHGSSTTTAVNNNNNNNNNNNITGSSNHRSSSSHRQTNSDTSANHHHHHGRDASGSKKQRLDYTTTHQSSSSIPSLSDNRFIDPNTGGDLGPLVTQLKDQVAMLNKKLQLKEKELLSKDQQIADLKSTSAREQRELREKINSLQKQHTERVSEMQAKLISLQKQIVSQAKAAKNNTATTYVEPPLVI